MTSVRLGRLLRVPRELLTPDEIDEDWRALSCPNPARVAAERRQDPRAYRIPERVSSLVVTADAIGYPAGAALDVARARLAGRAFDFIDDRPTFAAEPLEFRGELRPQQARAVDAAIAANGGIVVAPCGAGKTEIGLAIAARLGLPTLFLVGQREHAIEWCERARLRLGVAAGLVGAGHEQIERLTVALVPSLRDAARLERLAGRFAVVIVDECHHAAAPTYREVLGALRVRHRFGLTATPKREDGLDVFVEHHIGRVVARVQLEELVDAGLLERPKYTMICTAFDFAYASREDWPALLDALATDAARNRAIVELVARECTGGVVGLVLSGRVAHVEELVRLLVERGVRAVAIHGGSSKRARTDALERARAGAVDVVVGTQLADEGLDVPRLSRAFLAFPGRAEGRIIQRIGRILRPHPSKRDAVVFDFVDERVGPLRYQAKRRAAIVARTWSGSRRLPEVA